MPIIEVNGLATVGLVRDVEGYMLPPEAFTSGNNVRVKDEGIERIGGHTEVFEPIAPGNDEFTKVLLHFDDTTPVDESTGGSAKTWTANGTAARDLTQSVFGGASWTFDGNDDYIHTPDHADFVFGSGDWTIDFWFRFTGVTGSTRYLFGQNDGAGLDVSVQGYHNNTDTIATNVITDAGSFGAQSTTLFTNVVNPGWHHCALVRSDSLLKMFIDGTIEANNAITGTVINSGQRFSVGAIGLAAGVNTWLGNIEEFRVSVGVARWTANFTPPSIPYMTAAEAAPHYALPVANSSQTFWLWTSLTKAFVFDGAEHTEVTRASGDYNATNTRDWNGTLLGGVPILNNGTDIPQFWSAALSVAVPLANLTNWDSNHRAKVLRAFGPYLVAFNVTKSGTPFPHLVLWSHPADPGSVPNSWDVTDATKDAGQTDLADVQAGVIVEAMQLQGRMMIYKEGSTWRMSNIGGSFIFDFDSFLETSGILAPRCVAVTPDGTRHVVCSQDDIIVHNGNSAESVLTKRYRRYLFNQIDSTNYRNSFMWVNPTYNEVGFAYPTSGMTQPNMALVWNVKEGQLGALTEREVNFRNVATGDIQSNTPETWAESVGTWDSDTDPWSVLLRRKPVALHTDDGVFAEIDRGVTILGETISSTIQRVGLALAGKKRDGQPIVDFTSRKVMRRLWLKMDGGPVNVRIGFQSVPDGPVTWGSVKSFDPTLKRYVDVIGSGVAVAIEIAADVPWRLLGYSFEGELSGSF